MATQGRGRRRGGWGPHPLKAVCPTTLAVGRAGRCMRRDPDLVIMCGISCSGHRGWLPCGADGVILG